jgi:hypothetical protein
MLRCPAIAAARRSIREVIMADNAPEAPPANDQRLRASLALKAVISGVIGMGLFVIGPLALVLALVSLAKERHRVVAIIGLLLGGLDCVILGLVVANHLERPGRGERESAAVSVLRSEIRPAMVQFQGGAFRDEDRNQVGEHGFLTEMCGDAEPQARFLPAALNGTSPLVDGYRFIVYLPDGTGAASARSAIADHSPAAIALRERHWIAYAWPEKPDDRMRSFAVDERLILFCTSAGTPAGPPPAWNAALSQGWASAPAMGWVEYQK